jgi:hypothetical protein
MARLLDQGERIAAYDANLGSGPHIKGQIAYVRHASPAQARLMDALPGLAVRDAATLVAGSDVVVVSHATAEFRAAIEGRACGIHVLDLARLYRELPEGHGYQGIAW